MELHFPQRLDTLLSDQCEPGNPSEGGEAFLGQEQTPFREGQPGTLTVLLKVRPTVCAADHY